VVSIFSTVRDIERLRQIVVVLGRHGFGEVVQRTGLGRAVRKQGESEPPPPHSVPANIKVGTRIRMVLEDLGPSFVKLGQILSTRSDLIPTDIIEELKLLQENAQPLPFSDLRGQLEQELGAPVEEVYAEFDEKPLASASIAQVHRAKLRVPEGEAPEVVVKIQRPGIKNIVDRDIELLFILARALDRSIPESRIYNPVGLVREFATAMSSELNFNEEASHAARFSATFHDRPEARFPKVYPEASARNVITLEFLPGKKLGKAIESGYSGGAIAKTTLHVLLKQIFEDGFFHADPHPGNLLILGEPEAPVIGMIDLGLVGRLSPELRDKTIDLMVAAARQDARAVADALYAIGRPTKRIDRREYNNHVTGLAEKYLGKPLKEIEISALIRDIVQGALRFGLEIPPEFLMLIRTLMTVEGVGKEIYPDLDVLSETKPYFVHLLKARYSPERLGNDALRMVAKFSDTAGGMPEKLDELMDELLRGNLVVRTSDSGLREASEILGRHVFSGLGVASLIGGGSLLLSSGLAPIPGWIMIGAAAAWGLIHALRAFFRRRRPARQGPV
jgi:ubiquinone biosynthesis protein